MEYQLKQHTTTARDYFLDLVETRYNANKKTTLEQAFDLGHADWISIFPFAPPYKSFESFRKFREKKSR